MARHSALTGADLHEPKGVATATANTCYVADGAGSGAWSALRFQTTVNFPDVSAASSIYVSVPANAQLTRADSCLQGVIATADSVLSFTRNGSDAIGSITIEDAGSAAGDLDSLTTLANNTFTAGTYLKITSDGGSTNVVSSILTLSWTIQP